MTGSRLGLSLGLFWLSTGAFAAGSRSTSISLESLLRESRAAYFRGDYNQCMKLAMEVIIDDPEHRDARELMRVSATAMVERQILENEVERRRLLESARKIQARIEARRAKEAALRLKEDQAFQEQLERSEKARPSWSMWARGYVAHGEFLEAYRLIFLVKDQFPNDVWPELQLKRLERVLERERAALDAREAWYRDAVLGYLAYAHGKKEEAAKLWEAALATPEARAYPNRDAIERRLREIAPKRSEPAAAEKRPARRDSPSKPIAKAEAPKPAPVAPPTPAAKQGEVEALYIGGLVQYGMGHISEAIRTWEKVLALDPKHPAARRAVERAKKELGGKR